MKGAVSDAAAFVTPYRSQNLVPEVFFGAKEIPLSFDYLLCSLFSQVEGYTQGEEGVQEKMNQFVQW